MTSRIPPNASQERPFAEGATSVVSVRRSEVADSLQVRQNSEVTSQSSCCGSFFNAIFKCFSLVIDFFKSLFCGKDREKRSWHEDVCDEHLGQCSVGEGSDGEGLERSDGQKESSSSSSSEEGSSSEEDNDTGLNGRRFAGQASKGVARIAFDTKGPGNAVVKEAPTEPWELEAEALLKAYPVTFKELHKENKLIVFPETWDVNTHDPLFGQTLLHYLCANVVVLIGHVQNRAKVVHYLIAKKGADVNAKGEYGDTLLHRCDDPDIALELLKAGALPNAKGINGRTPLHVCKNAGVAGVILDHGGNISALDEKRWTPLEVASNKAMVELFLKRGATITNYTVARVLSCADGAIKEENCKGYLEAVEALIQAGVSVEGHHIKGLPTLIYIVEHYHLEHWKKMLPHFAKSKWELERSDLSTNQTALDIAINKAVQEKELEKRKHFLQAAQVLISHGAKWYGHLYQGMDLSTLASAMAEKSEAWYAFNQFIVTHLSSNVAGNGKAGITAALASATNVSTDESESLKTALQLIQKGTPVEEIRIDGKFLPHLIVMNYETEGWRKLLPLLAGKVVLDIVDNENKDTAFECALKEAAKWSDEKKRKPFLDAAVALVDLGCSTSVVLVRQSKPLLHQMVDSSGIESGKKLLALFAKDKKLLVQLEGQHYLTAFGYAIRLAAEVEEQKRGAYIDAAVVLAGAGADTSNLWIKSKPPIHFIVENYGTGWEKLLPFFGKHKSEFERNDDSNDTPLECAFRCAIGAKGEPKKEAVFLEAAEALTKEGCRTTNLVVRGKSPLHWIVENYGIEGWKKLWPIFVQNKAEFERKDRNDDTVLECVLKCAAKAKEESKIKASLDAAAAIANAGANTINRSINSKPPLHLIVENYGIEGWKNLLPIFAQNKDELKRIDGSHDTALEHALKCAIEAKEELKRKAFFEAAAALTAIEGCNTSYLSIKGKPPLRLIIENYGIEGWRNLLPIFAQNKNELTRQDGNDDKPIECALRCAVDAKTEDKQAEFLGAAEALLSHGAEWRGSVFGKQLADLVAERAKQSAVWKNFGDVVQKFASK